MSRSPFEWYYRDVTTLADARESVKPPDELAAAVRALGCREVGFARGTCAASPRATIHVQVLATEVGDAFVVLWRSSGGSSVGTGVELQTVLDDGRVVITARRPPDEAAFRRLEPGLRAASCDGYDLDFLAARTSVADLVAAHRARLAPKAPAAPVAHDTVSLYLAVRELVSANRAARLRTQMRVARVTAAAPTVAMMGLVAWRIGGSPPLAAARTLAACLLVVGVGIVFARPFWRFGLLWLGPRVFRVLGPRQRVRVALPPSGASAPYRARSGP